MEYFIVINPKYIYLKEGEKKERNQRRDQKLWRWNEVFCRLAKDASVRRR